MQDRFGNEIRIMSEEEKSIYEPEIKTIIWTEILSIVLPALALIFMLLYIVRISPQDLPPFTFVVVILVLVGILVINNSAINLYHALKGNLGILHISTDSVGSSSKRSRKPAYYIAGREFGTDKQICYPIRGKHYRALRDDFRKLREIDYIVVCPDKISYINNWFYYNLRNHGIPIVETAVYDSIETAVNNLFSRRG